MSGSIQTEVRVTKFNIMDSPLSFPAFELFLTEVDNFSRRYRETDSTWGEVIADFYSLKTSLDRITNNISGGYFSLNSVLKFNLTCYVTVQQYNEYLTTRVIPSVLRITIHDRIPVNQYVKFKSDLVVSKQYSREQLEQKHGLKWKHLKQN